MRIATSLRVCDFTALISAVESVQLRRRRGHDAAAAWGAWSRRSQETTSPLGHKPRVEACSGFATYAERPPAPGVLYLPNERTRRSGKIITYQDPLVEDEVFDAGLGEKADIVMHGVGFRAEWCSVIVAVYFYLHSRAEEWGQIAKVREHRFHTVLDDALDHLGQKL